MADKEVVEEEREPYMTHAMLLAEQSIDDLNAYEASFDGPDDDPRQWED